VFVFSLVPLQGRPQTLDVPPLSLPPPPPQVSGEVQPPQFAVRALPQLSAADNDPQFLP
jgi:hypothetical protein